MEFKLYVNEVMVNSFATARKYSHEYITLDHILYTLFNNSTAKEFNMFLTECDVDTDVVREQLNMLLNSNVIPTVRNSRSYEPTLSEEIEHLLGKVMTQHQLSNNYESYPNFMLFLLNLLDEDSEHSHAVYFLKKQGLTRLKVMEMATKLKDNDGLFSESESGISEDIKSDKNKKAAFEVLEKYAVNLNTRASSGKIDHLVGREDIIETTAQTLSRRSKNNVLLVGDAGVGKTAIVEGLAKKIVDGDVPETIKNMVIYSLSMSALVAGTKFRGDFEERMQKIVKAVSVLDNVVLFIDEIHTMMGAGTVGSGSMDVANIIKPALANGSMKMIGSTTYEEFRKHFEADRALMRRFLKVDVPEPSVEEAKKIVAGVAKYYEEYHKMTYTEDAINASVDLSHKYIHDKQLPDKAIDLLDSAAARQKILSEDVRAKVITVSHIEDELSKIARIPAKTVKEDETDKLKTLNDDLRSIVFGQDDAIDKLSDAVIVSRAGLRKNDKTLGAYLAVGPTGTGKTEMAKQLSKTLGLELIRFDMSEYMESHSVSKFIGTPPGYVGYGDGSAGSGLLINAIEKHPHSILLLDEVEKAHPDVMNILLQVMDNGMLTSSNGKTVSMRNVILFMTSNAGARDAQKKKIGFGDNSNDHKSDEAVSKFFSPEFRNRLDAVIKFNSLTKDNILRIVTKFLNELQIMCIDKKVLLNVDGSAKEYLAEHGYDVAMGARPLSRLIESEIVKPMSKEVVFGKLKNGGTVTVSCVDGKLSLKYKSMKIVVDNTVTENVTN